MPQSRSAMKATSHRRQLIVAMLPAPALVGTGRVLEVQRPVDWEGAG